MGKGGFCYMDYDKWLQRFTSRIERIVYRLTLLFVVLLFLVQAVLLNDYLRPYISYTDRFEGKALLEDLQKVIAGNVGVGEINRFEEPALLLELIPPPGEIPPDLTVIVNGKPQAQLSGDKLYLPVSPGDLLEVEGFVYGSNPAVIRIADVYGELQAPQKGREITTFGEKELVAWIIP
jgi:hypothetical protein